MPWAMRSGAGAEVEVVLCGADGLAHVRRLARGGAAGAKVDEVNVPAVVYGLSAYYLIAPAEASSNLARYDGVRYGLRVPAGDLTSMYNATRAAGFGGSILLVRVLGRSRRCRLGSILGMKDGDTPTKTQ